MPDSNDTEKGIDPATGLIQIGWPGGILKIRYVGIPTVSQEAEDRIENAMQVFSADCQMMLIWFAGTLNSQEAIRHHLNLLAQQDDSLTIRSLRPDGRTGVVFARVPIGDVIDAFSNTGEFERLYSKAFVVFTYQVWEEVARPTIADALKVKPKHVEADLMGEWRHLRNWLVHQKGDAEQDYFENAKTLVSLLKSQPGNPNLTADKVFILMKHLNNMSVEVNPTSTEFGIEFVETDPAFIAQIAETLKPGEGADLPAWASMIPTAVIVVLDGPTATIHELDCSQKDFQFQNADGTSWMRLASREVARAVIEQMGKKEQPCQHCQPNHT